MWDQFHGLGLIERFVIDNSAMTPEATAELIQKRIASGELRFPTEEV